MCCGNENCSCSFIKTLELILVLQQKGEDCEIDNGCSKPFLGPTPNGICLNTRPITLYSCCDNTLWTMPYTLNGTDGTSSVFRIENLNTSINFDFEYNSFKYGGNKYEVDKNVWDLIDESKKEYLE